MCDFELRVKDNISFFVCERLEREGFIAAFSTRMGGVSGLPRDALNLGFFSGDTRENVLENRRRFLGAIGADGRAIMTMHQVHGADTSVVSARNALTSERNSGNHAGRHVVPSGIGSGEASRMGALPGGSGEASRMDALPGGSGEASRMGALPGGSGEPASPALRDALPGAPKCDGIITTDSSLLLGVQTADCLPVIIADPDTRVVAGVHAGWKGTAARVVERTLACLRLEFGVETDGCFAAIGPSARSCCYEVGADVVQVYKKSFGYAKQLLIEQTSGKIHLDLVAANRQQLIYAGVASNNIFVAQHCTMCRPDLFFSYRKEKQSGKVGRMLAVIGSREPRA